LFPSANGDLKTACSCPDQANPCKHIAAVYYLIGEEFDRDPYLIFRLRGIERSELNDAIREMSNLQRADSAAPAEPAQDDRPASAVASADAPAVTARDESARSETRPREEEDTPRRPKAEPVPMSPEPPPVPLPADPHSFWAGTGSTAEDVREVRIPKTVAALPRRLGGYPFWGSELDSRSLLDHIYRNASPAGLDVFIGASESQEEPGRES
jgi:uncharacterized Zn finger protein